MESYAPSSEIVRQLDELQNELGEGPRLDSIWYEQRTVVEDMAEAHDRWPRYVAAARERGVGSLMSFQLFANSGSAGALNLYASTPRVYDDATADTGALFAAKAALMLHGAKRVHQLNHAVATRDLIGQAKGILVERLTVTPERAFTLLVESSQQDQHQAGERRGLAGRRGPGEGRERPDPTLAAAPRRVRATSNRGDAVGERRVNAGRGTDPP